MVYHTVTHDSQDDLLFDTDDAFSVTLPPAGIEEYGIESCIPTINQVNHALTDVTMTQVIQHQE